MGRTRTRLDKPLPKIKPQPLKWLRHFFTTLDKLDKLWTKQLVQMLQAGAASLVALFCIRAAITKNPVRKW
jgi:hypothetical protein